MIKIVFQEAVYEMSHVILDESYVPKMKIY